MRPQQCNHVEEESSPHLMDDEWRKADATIVLWIYTTICDDLQDIVMEADATAFSAWERLRLFFYANQPGRELHLSQEFRSIVQGDLSITEYCHRIKNVADALAEVGAPMSDKAITLQMIDGLDERYKIQQELFPSLVPFPSFMQAQSRLQLAETTLKKKATARAANPQVLVVNGNGNGNPGGDRAQNINGNDNQGRDNVQNGNRNGNYGGDRGRGRGRGRGDHGGRGPNQAWMGYFAPAP
ncbi:uncharacterized protein LOC104582022 [Brachypodium distachyon]|uniref:uncharacterized protein LOC104582022 n=1 Tax=Brachypodium distachyon TaxID=15368 RepID=UPI000530017A|nr:uncharacterized protein LOC104582022 [Brachypodium distachyon]|eukprot:XP_010229588.1 uncharacterized protein LOC104582022 [Brachypodium distachyon]